MYAPQTLPLAPTPPVIAAASTVHSASHSAAHSTAHSAARGTTDSPPAEEDGEEVPALCCAACGSVIVTRDELLVDRAETPPSAVYAYELDLLDEEVWAYSATNPEATRYDVIRTKPSKSVFTYGSPTPVHTWFVTSNPKL